MSGLLFTLWTPVLAALLAGTVGAAPARGQDPDAIARRADRALAALASLRADFVEEVENPVLERTTTGRGTLLYDAPDRYRIAWSDPAGDVVVDDGTHVWIYLPSSQPDQVIRQPAGAASAQNPLTYLRDLRGDFTARWAGRESVGGETTDHLAFAPAGDDAPFARLDVWVGRSTDLPRRIRTETGSGVVTTYTFRTLRRNADVEPADFRFRPPPGVEVYDQ